MGWFGFGSKTSVTPEAARDALQGNAVLIDVREPHEWKAGHVRGALHIPLGKIPTSLSRIPKGKDVYVICQSGMRSSSAVSQLRKAGVEAINVKGGMNAWIRKVGL